MTTPVAQITTYAELQDAVADALDRDDLTTVIQQWIALCEKRVNRVLEHHDMISKSEAQLASGDNTISLPTDWRSADNIEFYYDTETIDDAEHLEYLTREEMDIRRSSVTDDSPGRPCFFTYYGTTMEVWPVPDANGKLAMEYSRKVPALATTDPNWLLTEAPDVYLYGSLVHSAPYLRDDPRLGLWSSLFKEAIVEMRNQSRRAMYSGSRLVRRPSVVLG